MKFQKKYVSWNKGLTKETDCRLKEIAEKISKSLKGRRVWNKGLTKETDERVRINEKTREKMSIAHKGKKKSEETKQKMSIIGLNCTKHLKGKTYEEIYGNQRAKEIKSKLSEKQKQRKKISAETKQKLRIGKLGSKNPFYGKHHKIETIEKIRESLVGRTFSKEHRMKIGVHTKRRRAIQIFPKYDSSIEIKIQDFLKQLGIEYFTHQYMKIEHSYQCDILIPVQTEINQKIIIEVDGDYWHGNSLIFSNSRLNCRILKQREIDKLRTKELIKKGFKVLRLWENEIKQMDIDKFKERLYMGNAQFNQEQIKIIEENL